MGKWLLKSAARVLIGYLVAWKGAQHVSLGLACLLGSLSTGSAFVADLKDRTGAVSSESKICSEIGIGLLQRGVRVP